MSESDKYAEMPDMIKADVGVFTPHGDYVGLIGLPGGGGIDVVMNDESVLLSFEEAAKLRDLLDEYLADEE